ncbi:hypothetical protein SAY87_030452 [Trapa incisa]|uniref:Bifunctional inhibitor/plant lipid transfer protein/seed storage helical domain-containing protein n=2 Tax=Trapa TaxID=22665 RepID=A0AAN7LGN3_TRANT|nr:hypothetical protein SAY87_030452 [Trapa incisa]KAK4787738.1 hypothetical protein SAY86_011571 [Trapa natans]
MANFKTILRAMLMIPATVLMIQFQLMGAAMGQSCPVQLSNLNVCAPFVVPGAPTTAPSPDCCNALQLVSNDCLCSTLRIASTLPTACRVPPLSCSTE